VAYTHLEIHEGYRSPRVNYHVSISTNGKRSLLYFSAFIDHL
jgi:hypothetical protein